MRPPTFTSVLAPDLRSLAEYRQALGYRDHSLLNRLAHFDRYLVARGWMLPYLTRELVQDWVYSGALQPRSRAKRLEAMRLLGGSVPSIAEKPLGQLVRQQGEPPLTREPMAWWICPPGVDDR